MTMLIRHAKFDDIQGLVPLLSQLGYPCDLETLTTRFVRFLKNAGYGIVICTIDNNVVGLIAWSKSELFVADIARTLLKVILLETQGVKIIGLKV